MHLSTRGRYAIMAMLDLAELTPKTGEGGLPKPITLAQIAERQNISLSYLEQLFAKLRKAGVVDSIRGPGGGYVLKNPRAITLADIIAAVDEVVDITRCGNGSSIIGPKKNAGCVYGHKCNAHDLWDALGRHIEGFMQRITLQMLIDQEITPEFSMFSGPAAHPAEALRGLQVRVN